MADPRLTAKFAAAVVIAIRHKRRNEKRKHKLWMRKWLKNRPLHGAYHHLLQELELDTSSYRNFLCMDSSSFEELLRKVAPKITHQDTILRDAIPPCERLAVTLRYLATGETFESLKFLYRISAQSIGKIIPETCQAIVDVLAEEYLKVPQTHQEWEAIVRRYEQLWNFNNCIGALDGKHIRINPPHNSGSDYYNYKHFFSLVLMAIVDADYRFIYIDIGCNGQISDGGVFKNCSMYNALETNQLNIPKPTTLPGSSENVPYVLVADDAFSLSQYLMKPYSQTGLNTEKRIFNYRLSRARRTVENTFGILSNRFRVLMSPIALQPEKVRLITLTSCVLHNYLRSHAIAKDVYCPPGSVDSEDPVTHEVQWAD